MNQTIAKNISTRTAIAEWHAWMMRCKSPTTANGFFAVAMRFATDAKRLSVGLKVTMTTASGVTVPGTVSDIASAPVPAVNAAARVALTLPDDSGYILVAVTADTPLTPGDQLSGSFVISEQTLAQRLMSGL